MDIFKCIRGGGMMNTHYEQQSTLMTLITGNNKRNNHEHTRSKFKKKPGYYDKKANNQENKKVALQYNYENKDNFNHLFHPLYTVNNPAFDVMSICFLMIGSMIVLMIINRFQI